jgi:uncharacterized membrane protein SpoIIM required for sporulation
MGMLKVIFKIIVMLIWFYIGCKVGNYINYLYKKLINNIKKNKSN